MLVVDYLGWWNFGGWKMWLIFEMLIDVWVWVYDVYKNVLLILLYKNYVLGKMLEVL